MRYETSQHDMVMVVKFFDRLAFADHASFRTLLELMKQTGPASVVFDLEQMSSIDSAGLGMFIIAQEASKRDGWVLTLRNPNTHVKQLLMFGRFDKLLNISSQAA